ncbi:hypothetical protein [Oryzomonas rubra]|uniref:Uncharacterized protein n=1 Tax=Oryzomonas rubra TaxID=2509454 RepID=A0A5A9XC77_9BACT|nr:hypothetical protein [Oryzomonas rubra]KAA0890404.1 hypothetical protein ET418_12115 [Oryzomonas rubra]
MRTTILARMVLTACLVLSICLSQAYCDEVWRTEFEEACARTADVMTLSDNELKALIGKCERLQKVIEQQDETARKVYLKRLQMCKNLYVYILEAKNSEKTQK